MRSGRPARRSQRSCEAASRRHGSFRSRETRFAHRKRVPCHMQTAGKGWCGGLVPTSTARRGRERWPRRSPGCRHLPTLPAPGADPEAEVSWRLCIWEKRCLLSRNTLSGRRGFPTPSEQLVLSCRPASEGGGGAQLWGGLWPFAGAASPRSVSPAVGRGPASQLSSLVLFPMAHKAVLLPPDPHPPPPAGAGNSKA